MKYIDTPFISWEAYNQERKENSIYSGSLARDKNKLKHYMGVYMPDGCYKRFITLGSKRYAYEDDEGLHITVSGVSKQAGVKELGCLERFKDGFTFMHSGKTASRYVDQPMNDRFYMYDEKGGEQWIEITPYILIEETTYTLSLTEEYRQLIGMIEQ